MFLKPFKPVGRGPLSDELFEYLQGAIVEGDLEPGTRLVEEAVAEATSVSRTPVREALRRLKAVGLVTNQGRSFVVAKLSSEELHEIWVVMEYLQGLSARLAALHRSEMDLAELQSLVKQGRLVTKATDIVGLVELNRRFHNVIHRAAGNRALAEMINTAVLRVEGLQDFTTARRRIQAQTEHERLVEGIEKQDPDMAESAMHEHLRHQFLSATDHAVGQIIGNARKTDAPVRPSARATGRRQPSK